MATKLRQKSLATRLREAELRKVELENLGLEEELRQQEAELRKIELENLGLEIENGRWSRGAVYAFQTVVGVIVVAAVIFTWVTQSMLPQYEKLEDKRREFANLQVREIELRNKILLEDRKIENRRLEKNVIAAKAEQQSRNAQIASLQNDNNKLLDQQKRAGQIAVKLQGRLDQEIAKNNLAMENAEQNARKLIAKNTKDLEADKNKLEDEIKVLKDARRESESYRVVLGDQLLTSQLQGTEWILECVICKALLGLGSSSLRLDRGGLVEFVYPEVKKLQGISGFDINSWLSEYMKPQGTSGVKPVFPKAEKSQGISGYWAALYQGEVSKKKGFRFFMLPTPNWSVQEGTLLIFLANEKVEFKKMGIKNRQYDGKAFKNTTENKKKVVETGNAVLKRKFLNYTELVREFFAPKESGSKGQ